MKRLVGVLAYFPFFRQKAALRSLQPLFGYNAKIYLNALNFTPHVNWKLLLKLRSFDIKMSHALANTGLKGSISGNFCVVCLNL